MDVCFTIVAKNYLSFALTLGDSLKKQDQNLDFYIFIVDDLSGVPTELVTKYKTIVVNETIVTNHLEMAFKYNITEYSTSIKPYIFSYLFNNNKYEKIIYSDPDIYFYQSPNIIYNLLDFNFCILTPHLIDIETAHKSEATDVGLLFAGIFNLGFIALRKCDDATVLLNWWQQRLRDYCYGERMESLHTDQKWIDFVPSFFKDGVNISHNKGFNIAYWNIHERLLIENNNELVVVDNENVLVTFLHFSGNNPLNILVNKQCKNLNISNYPVWKKYILDYGKKVEANDFATLIKLQYKYNSFTNGDTISSLHRRMYRKLQELNKTDNYQNPFEIKENSYYHLLKQNNLLIGNQKASIDFVDEGEKKISKKIHFVFLILGLLKNIIGVRRYTTFIRAFQKLFTNENQVHLIKSIKKEFVDHYVKKISQ
jgi:hypothetical protein